MLELFVGKITQPTQPRLNSMKTPIKQPPHSRTPVPVLTVSGSDRFRCGGRGSNFLVRAAVLLSVVLGLLITGATAWGATHFNVRTSGGSYGTPYAYFGDGATAAGGYWEQYRKTDSGAYPGVTGTASTFDTVRYEALHQGCGGTGCHFVAPGVFFGNAAGSIPANQRISLIDSAGISPTTETQTFDLRVGFVVNPASFVTTNRGDNGSEDLVSDWGAASGQYFHLEIAKDPGGNWRISHSGTHFAADGVHEGVRPNLSFTGNHDTGVPNGEALALNWWLDGTTLHFEAGNTHLSHTDGRFITGVPAFFSGRAAWSDGTPTSYQILGIATPPPAPPLALKIVKEGGDVKISWTDPANTAVLQESTDFIQWTDLPNAVSPYVSPASDPRTFWRLRP